MRQVAGSLQSLRDSCHLPVVSLMPDLLMWAPASDVGTVGAISATFCRTKHSVQIAETLADLTSRLAAASPLAAIVDESVRPDEVGQMRRSGHFPILVIGSTSISRGYLTALRSGADDYMPVHLARLMPTVLAARIQLYGRVQVNRPVVLSLTQHTATKDHVRIQLSPAEAVLLDVLVRHAGNTVSRHVLLERAGAAHRPLDTRTCDHHISSLRRKLSSLGESTSIVTIRHHGYAWRGSRTITADLEDDLPAQDAGRGAK